MVANASTLGPSIVALCLRAGWKLGGVTEMYHFRLDAGDLNVVRRAACLDIETKYYGYRPYFNCSDLDQNGKLAAMAMAKADRWLKEHIPKFCRSQNNSNRQMIILCRSTLNNVHFYTTTSFVSCCNFAWSGVGGLEGTSGHLGGILYPVNGAFCTRCKNYTGILSTSCTYLCGGTFCVGHSSGETGSPIHHFSIYVSYKQPFCAWNPTPTSNSNITLICTLLTIFYRYRR